MCITGGEAERAEAISIIESVHSIRISGNPDLFDRRYESFTIEDARAIKSLAETRPAAGGAVKIFLIMAKSMTVEAQNALLKLLEEPPSYAHFFFIIPSAHILLPTVRSRMRLVSSHGSVHDTVLAEEFLRVPPTKRMDWIKSFMDDISKDKRPKHDAVELIKSLESVIAKRTGHLPAGLSKDRAALEAIMLAERYSSDRAPSMKMLLEYIAMNL